MNKYPKSSNDESGAALLVAMVILFMISILGISAMQSSNVETQLASNALVKETTFQSAESATDAILSLPNILADVVCQEEPNDTVMSNLNRSANQETTSRVQYGGLALTLGYDISDKFATHRFYISGESSIEDMNTSTRIVKGHTEVGPASNGGGC